MKKAKKIFISIIISILVLIVLLNLYNFISIKIFKKDLATINGYSALEVVSGSMEPTIHVGDIIIINTKADEYKKDDIITFYDEEGSFVTHRIIAIDEDNMITKGDNNNSEDKPISTDNIVGKYCFKINGLGKLISALKNPITMVLILAIGILACILVSLDDQGKPIIGEEEKELEEFRKYKESLEKNKELEEKVKTDNVKKVEKSKKDEPAKTVTKKKMTTKKPDSSRKKTTTASSKKTAAVKKNSPKKPTVKNEAKKTNTTKKTQTKGKTQKKVK